jgi:hypothetical protein
MDKIAHNNSDNDRKKAVSNALDATHGCGERSSADLCLDSILARDARDYTMPESPWFAARTVAMAREIPQKSGLIGFGSKIIGTGFFLKLPNFRWLLPLPLAGVAAALLLIQHHPLTSPSRTFSSSESSFEQNMEMLASSDYAQDYFIPNSDHP